MPPQRCPAAIPPLRNPRAMSAGTLGDAAAARSVLAACGVLGILGVAIGKLGPGSPGGHAVGGRSLRAERVDLRLQARDLPGHPRRQVGPWRQCHEARGLVRDRRVVVGRAAVGGRGKEQGPGDGGRGISAERGAAQGGRREAGCERDQAVGPQHAHGSSRRWLASGASGRSVARVGDGLPWSGGPTHRRKHRHVFPDP